MGYHRAGFDVVGVDINPQPDYPFEFHQGDALEYLAAHWQKFDVVHASPPCQHFSTATARWGRQGEHLNLIPPTRTTLIPTGLPYVIENVPGAAGELIEPVELCGQMFGLGVFRHRLFETSFDLPSIEHAPHIGRIGDGRMVTVTGHPGGSSRRDGIQHGAKASWEVAMGIDWMTARGLAQALPPAYTEYIGRKLIAWLS